MIVGLILAGAIIGAGTGVGALLLGSSIWFALLLYSAVGVASVLGAALFVALRPDRDQQNAPVQVYSLAGPGRS